MPQHNKHLSLPSSTLIALMATALVVGVGATPAVAAPGVVTGTVFRDFDADGILDTGNVSASGLANDTGFPGVTVTAFDDAGASWTTTSGADGTYTLDIAGSSADAVRVEFTGIPEGYEHGAVHAPGSTTGTAVQFVAVGSAGVDFSINAPDDYSQGASPLVTAVQWAGSPLASEGGTQSAEPALAGVAYDAGFNPAPQPGGFPGRVTLATFGEVGAISSSVYQPSSNSILVAATYKRQSGLGSLGLGGIYQVTDVLDASNAISDAGTVVPWLDVEAIGIDVGTALSNAARGLAGAQTPTNDSDAFAQAGKVGIGDMVLSVDGKTLYFINLFDKRLYALDVSNPGVAPTTFESYDLGLATGERPWALTLYRGGVYVGYVDSGETDAGAQTGQPAADAGLQAHVITIDETALGGAWTEVFAGDLGYAKGRVYGDALAPQSLRWNTWTDTWTWPGGQVAENFGGWHIYPQPILSDLYFDEDGYLSMGFTDRTSIQGGNRNVASDPAVPGVNFETGASGDTLISSPNPDGTYTLENDGVAGDRTTSSTLSDQGPGGRNFYDDGQNLGGGSGQTHMETTLGQLAGVRGTREVVSTGFDPLSGIRLAGLYWLSVDNGEPVSGYELTGDGGGNGAGGNFQKGGGLGSISVLALAAPIEVGNRTWIDLDKDGIQDPSEPALPGLTVELVQAGVVIGTVTTDANGEYYFSSDPTSPYYVAGLAPGGDYTVRFVKPTTGNLYTNDPVYGTVPWTAVDFTIAEVESTETGSNPDPATGEYPFTTGGPGENNHSIDAGIIFPRPAVDIEKGDGEDGEIVHDADTVDLTEEYEPGESRTIEFIVTNTGDEDLREVVLTDETLSGSDITELTWTMPDGSTVDAVDVGGVLTATWEATFDPGTSVWMPGDIITGTATFAIGTTAEIHENSATVSAVGARSEQTVTDSDDYHASTVGLPPVTQPAGGVLGSTGANVIGVIAAGILVLLAGGALLLLSRRTRATN